jgi:hypothetical protein
MLDLAEALKAEPPRQVVARPSLAQRSFSMQRLRRLSVWGGTAACALLVAALASRSPVGLERITLALNGGGDQQAAATPPFDAQAATERLAEAVRGLAANDAEIKTKLASVEQDMDDVTGSVSKQLAAAQTASAARRAEDGPTVIATATQTAAMAAPDSPSRAAAVMLAAIQPPADATLPAIPGAQFGVDIGSGLTIQALRVRWIAIRSTHPELFAGLQPVISVKEVPHGNRVELRLVAGPIAQPAAATQLCATLSALGQFCQPTFFDGQRLALQ